MIEKLEILEGRMAKLEQENRRWRRMAAFAAAGAAMVVFIGAATPKTAKGKKPIVEASELRLVDSEGNLHALLALTKTGAALTMKDISGNDRVRLALAEEGTPRLDLIDASGAPRLSAALDRNVVPGVTLFDSEKHVRAAFSIGADGTPQFALSDGEGNARASMTLDGDGLPRLRLSDADGSTRASLGATPLKEVNSGVSQLTEPSTLVLINRKGEVVFKAPK